MDRVAEPLAKQPPQGGGRTEDVIGATQAGPVQEHHGFGRGGFVWIFPGDQRGYGTDFVQLRDGLMQIIVVFGAPGPPSSAS